LARLWLPWLSLSRNFILKHETHDHPKYFNTEKKAYLQLRRWWNANGDDVLPYYYGEAYCNIHNKRALILIEAKGIPLYRVPAQDLEDAFEKLKLTYDKISRDGVMHGDALPEHAFISNQGATLIHWNLAEFSNDVAAAGEMNELNFKQMQAMVVVNKRKKKAQVIVNDYQTGITRQI